MTRLAVLLLLAGCDKLLSLGDIHVPIDAPPGPVQQVTNFSVITTTLAASLPQQPVAGNLLVMVGATPANALSSVTGGGAQWQRGTLATANINVEIWYGITDGSSATVTIACPTC